MKNVLITGVAGNIGSALASALIKTGRYKVIGVDNLSTGSLHKVPAAGASFSFIKADVNCYEDISAIFFANKVDLVFHFAAVVGVARTLANPLAVLNDIAGIKNVLSLSKNSVVERVFFSSSSEVYGEPVSIPQYEDSTPLNSKLPYAIVKNLGEAFCRAFYQEHHLRYTIFRFFNTYGPNQSDDFVIPRFINLALRNIDIPIYGDGSQTRTFCYVDDNVDAMLACLEKDIFINEVVNIGSDVEMSILDLAHIVLKITGSTSAIRYLPKLPEGDMTRRRPDVSKMRIALSRELLPVDQGISKLIAHFTENR
jgi:UDP-glucuronate decarboxylase